MIDTLLDACRYILEDQGEAQSSYWLASQIDGNETLAGERVQVRQALNKDIEKHGESSLFVKVGEDEYALRSWKAR